MFHKLGSLVCSDSELASEIMNPTRTFVGIPLQGLYLHMRAQYRNVSIHPFLERDSNLRPQCSIDPIPNVP
jgi:hypothetical protein